jgi:hypothetical protein
MADASEDTIWTMKIASEDVDLSDETQDFRVLAQLTEFVARSLCHYSLTSKAQG